MQNIESIKSSALRQLYEANRRLCNEIDEARNIAQQLRTTVDDQTQTIVNLKTQLEQLLLATEPHTVPEHPNRNDAMLYARVITNGIAIWHICDRTGKPLCGQPLTLGATLYAAPYEIEHPREHVCETCELANLRHNNDP